MVAGLAIMAATLIGFVVGVARLSSNVLLRSLTTVYVETLRNIPLLLQILLWYFAILVPLPPPRQSLSIGGHFFLNNRGLYFARPEFETGFWWVMIAVLLLAGAIVIGSRWLPLHRPRPQTGASKVLVAALLLILIGTAFVFTSWQWPELRGFNYVGGWVLIPEFVALWIALSTYTATYIAEIVRAGIQSVSPGQREAAYALGLNPSQTLRLVIIPQALRVIIPPLCGQYLNLTKNSSLGVAIAYPELVSVFAGTVLNQTGQAIEVIGITMAVYLALSLTISMFMNWYNNRMAFKG